MSSSSSEEYLDTESEVFEYVSNSESLDYDEKEVEEELNIAESAATVEEGEIYAYMDEPLADAEWFEDYNRQQEEKKKQEEVLKKRLGSEIRTGEWCTCGNCSRELLKNISECYCCKELDGCVESLSSELVVEAIPEGQSLTCITDHPGFQPVVLDVWSLRMSVSKFNTREKKRYKQTGSEDRLLRSVAYREFSRLVYGFLGKKRIPLPECAYTAIRKKYPLQDGDELTGFIMED